MRKNDRSADLLIRLSGVDSELEVRFDGLVELSGRYLLYLCERLGGVVSLALLDGGDGCIISLSVFHVSPPP